MHFVSKRKGNLQKVLANIFKFDFLKKHLCMLHRSLEIFVLQLKCTKISFPLFRSSTLKVSPFFLALSGGLVWRLAQSGLWFDGQVIVPLTCLAGTKSAPLFSRPEELECTPLPPSPSSPSSLSFPFPSPYFPPSSFLSSSFSSCSADCSQGFAHARDMLYH